LKGNHDLLRSSSVKEVKETLHAKEQEEDRKVRKKYEAKAKSDVNVANAKKEKSELEVRISCLLTDHLSNQQQINYGYDFELYSSTSAKGTSE
jgi:Tfp pilus assembly protein PilO